jgi:hypothetical protein
MSATVSMASAASTAKGNPSKGTRPGGSKPGGADLGKDNGREAKRMAAAILEVLAGARTPAEAATALGVSVPRYYQVESRALRGLLAACEPQIKGRVRSPHKEVTVLRRDKERLQREVLRQQALVRAAQRSVGLTPPAAPPAAKSGGKKSRRRRVARALSVAARLQPDKEPTTASAPVTAPLPTTQEAIL